MAHSIDIARDFSPTPGPRYEEEGPFSGEAFRKTMLLPAYDGAVQTGEKLSINLNGTEGYATSFLEEAFGGLARIYGESAVLNNLSMHCDDDPFLIAEITTYIEEANDPKNSRGR